MNIKVKLFSTSSLFLGFKFLITKYVEDMRTYDPEKEYPDMYVFELGLLFIEICIEKKGRS
jgi:hypothetical protein